MDRAATLGAYALIVADVALLAHAGDHHLGLRRHLSVQASATTWEAIEFYRERYGIQRAVLPRVLTLSQVQHTLRHTAAQIEVFGFGSLRGATAAAVAGGRPPGGAGTARRGPAPWW